jgi:hypothetical protein
MNIFNSFRNVWTTETIRFEVWDNDKIGKDEFEGQCHLAVHDVPHGMQGVEKTINLLPRNKSDIVSGYIKAKIAFEPIKL